MCKNFRISITAPLPGWRRFENLNDGRTVDFNPKDAAHRILLAYYETRPEWREVATPCPADVEPEI